MLNVALSRLEAIQNRVETRVAYIREFRKFFGDLGWLLEAARRLPGSIMAASWSLVWALGGVLDAA